MTCLLSFEEETYDARAWAQSGHCPFDIFLDNFPRFSVRKSLKILEKHIANFFKGYIDYLRTNQTSSQLHD